MKHILILAVSLLAQVASAAPGYVEQPTIAPNEVAPPGWAIVIQGNQKLLVRASSVSTPTQSTQTASVESSR